jgi:hypothetical protein
MHFFNYFCLSSGKSEGTLPARRMKCSSVHLFIDPQIFQHYLKCKNESEIYKVIRSPLGNFPRTSPYCFTEYRKQVEGFLASLSYLYPDLCFSRYSRYNAKTAIKRCLQFLPSFPLLFRLRKVSDGNHYIMTSTAVFQTGTLELSILILSRTSNNIRKRLWKLSFSSNVVSTTKR